MFKTMMCIGVMFAIGCSGVSKPLWCENPKGLYHVAYVTQSGDCGDITGLDVVIPHNDTSNCHVVASSSSDDNCSGSSSISCTGNEYTFACSGKPNGFVAANPSGYEPCATGLSLCTNIIGGAECVNFKTDSKYCGSCGNECQYGAECVNAKCRCVGYQSESDLITIDANADGSQLNGTMGVQVNNMDGSSSCSGVYSFTETKVHD